MNSAKSATTTLGSGSGLLRDLVHNTKIEGAIPWKELGDEDRIERLRAYMKATIQSIVTTHTRELVAMQRRINYLEQHTHNEKGEAVTTERLMDRANRPEAVDPLPYNEHTVSDSDFI